MTPVPGLKLPPDIQGFPAVAPDGRKQRQATPAVPPSNCWSTVSLSTGKCLVVHTTSVSGLLQGSNDWNTPKSAFLWNLRWPNRIFFLFTRPSWWSTYALKLENFHPSHFHPIASRCWWYACEVSNLLKHKSSPLILISCCSEFPRSIVCSGEKSASFHPF